MDLSLRDSTISLNDVGLQMDNLQPGADLVAISNSEIVGNLTGILVNNTTASAVSVVSISGSQIVASDNAVLVSNSAVGGNTWVETMDSVIGFTGNNGLVLSNSAADANTLMSLSMERSRVANTAGTAVTLNATNGSAIDMHVRDSTFIGAQTLLKTAGTASQTYVSLIRSNLSHAGTAIDHGQGSIELDSTHVNLNVKDFVNNGSGNIVSNGLNMVHNNVNPVGPTYITPNKILLEARGDRSRTRARPAACLDGGIGNVIAFTSHGSRVAGAASNNTGRISCRTRSALCACLPWLAGSPVSSRYPFPRMPPLSNARSLRRTV